MKATVVFLLWAALAAAQVTLPGASKISIRLDQTISSSTAEQGQTVELSVTEPVRAGNQIVIFQGARVTGTVTQAQEKRQKGTASKLDFSIDRVRVADGEWVPFRTTINKITGGSARAFTTTTDVLFWPAAQVASLIKGKEIAFHEGMVFEAYTDHDHVIHPITAFNAFKPVPPAAIAPTSALTITSNVIGADIEVDGHYVGSTPATLLLTAGQHRIAVTNEGSVWQRNLPITTGRALSVNAQFEEMQTALRRTH